MRWPGGLRAAGELAGRVVRRRARLLIIVGVALVTLSAATLMAGSLLLARYTASVHQAHLLGGAAATASGGDGGTGGGSGVPAHATINGPINLLLVGIDERANDPAGGARSDTIMIVHIPASHDHAYLISIPRDSRVSIPAYPATGYPGGADKINAAFAYGYTNGGGRTGGFQLLALTVKQLTGISFNAGAIINFNGLRSVVDALGGVDLCVDEETTSVHVGWTASGAQAAPYDLIPPDYHPVRIPGVRPQVYHVGCQHLVGWQALDYVRQRELIPDGDYGRERHQQQLVTALAKKIVSGGMLLDPLAVDRALRATGDSITFDGNGVSLVDWIFAMKEVDPNAITMLKTNGGQFTTQVIGGQDFEILNETSMRMFAALRDDSLASFAAAHPDWVSTAAAPAQPSSPPTTSGR